MADGSELKDEFAVLVQHMQRFFVEDCRPWAEVRYTLFIAFNFNIPAAPRGRSFVLDKHLGMEQVCSYELRLLTDSEEPILIITMTCS